MQAKEYRKDIDVLRAIAVAAVIFFHFEVPFFTGGYVGVSIFFVISGYLITKNIKNSLAADAFSFLTFYENRIRRIIPALFAVLTVSYFSFLIFCQTSYETHYLARSLRRVLLAASNFFFYTNTDYFDPAENQNPFLHTWSLAVEEQFYFLVPLLLVFLLKKLRLTVQKTTLLLCLLCVFSFASSAFFLKVNPKFAFYMLPARAGELLIGSILAFSEWSPSTPNRKTACLILGLCLMIFSVVGFENSTYPGLWALIPCIGAFLFISGNTDNPLRHGSSVFSKILYNKFFIIIGVISYSLYLWHWPFFVFFSFALDSALYKCIIILCIFLLSFLSWKYIEQPVRLKQIFKKRKVLWPLFLLIFAALFSVADRMDNPLNLNLTLSDTQPLTAYKPHYPYNPEQKQILILGDSHALAQSLIYEQLFEKYGLSGQFFSVKPKACHEFEEKIPNGQTKLWTTLENTIKKQQTDTVILIFRFTSYLGFDYSLKSPALRINAPDANAGAVLLYNEFARFIELCLANGVKNICIQAPLPEPRCWVPAVAYKYRLFNISLQNLNAKFGEKTADYRQRTKEAQNMLEKLQRQYSGVSIINAAEQFLSAKEYFDITGPSAVYFLDDDHLSKEGSLKLLPVYDGIFKQTAKRLNLPACSADQ